MVSDNSFDGNRSQHSTMKEYCRVAFLGHIGQVAYTLVSVSYRKMGTLIFEVTYIDSAKGTCTVHQNHCCRLKSKSVLLL